MNTSARGQSGLPGWLGLLAWLALGLFNVSGAQAAPSVSLTAPDNGATYTAPATITLNATATETGGTIARVVFSHGARISDAIGATTAPYTYTWSNVPAGSYSLTAVATDTNNVSTTSSPVSVSVGAAVASQVYYIYTDQLNTPRLITDTANTPVWRNDQADPFNASAPYDDPGNTGKHFVFNLRFPGQYYDQETGLAYNYYRDYDANTGRYIQSDPIGLMGGMNTYAYVRGNPLSYVDPYGLAGEIPDPNKANIPGGPYTKNPNSPRAGEFYGPKPPKGQRTTCNYVPKESTSGPKPYFEVDVPGKGRQRYYEGGEPITAEQAHGYTPRASPAAAAGEAAAATGTAGFAAFAAGVAAMLYSPSAY